MSKTFSVTGWRVGFCLAPEYLSRELRKVHDYTSICAPTPFQRAGVEALSLPEDYYEELSASYERRRDVLCEGLEAAGLDPVVPDGAYYVMARYPTDESDVEFSHRLVRERAWPSCPAGASTRSPTRTPTGCASRSPGTSRPSARRSNASSRTAGGSRMSERRVYCDDAVRAHAGYWPLD